MSRTPSFAVRDTPVGSRRRGEIFALVALVLVLGGQLFFGERAALAANAQARPLVAAACDALRCSLPPWREPAAFVMLARDVIDGGAGVDWAAYEDATAAVKVSLALTGWQATGGAGSSSR